MVYITIFVFRSCPICAACFATGTLPVAWERNLLTRTYYYVCLFRYAHGAPLYGSVL